MIYFQNFNVQIVLKVEKQEREKKEKYRVVEHGKIQRKMEKIYEEAPGR